MDTLLDPKLAVDPIYEVPAPAKDRKQIREIRPHGAPFGVKRVHGVAGEGPEMRLASRSTRRHRISDGNTSS